MKKKTEEQRLEMLEIALKQLTHQNYHANSGDIANRIREFVESDGKVCIHHAHEAAAVIECNDCQIDFIK